MAQTIIRCRHLAIIFIEKQIGLNFIFLSMQNVKLVSVPLATYLSLGRVPEVNIFFLIKAKIWNQKLFLNQKKKIYLVYIMATSSY